MAAPRSRRRRWSLRARTRTRRATSRSRATAPGIVDVRWHADCARARVRETSGGGAPGPVALGGTEGRTWLVEGRPHARLSSIDVALRSARPSGRCGGDSGVPGPVAVHARRRSSNWFWNQLLQSHPGRRRVLARRGPASPRIAPGPVIRARCGVGTRWVHVLSPQRPRGQRGVLEVFFHHERAPVARSACASGRRAVFVAVVRRERAGAGGARRGAPCGKKLERPEPRTGPRTVRAWEPT